MKISKPCKYYYLPRQLHFVNSYEHADTRVALIAFIFSYSAQELALITPITSSSVPLNGPVWASFSVHMAAANLPAST